MSAPTRPPGPRPPTASTAPVRPAAGPGAGARGSGRGPARRGGTGPTRATRPTPNALAQIFAALTLLASATAIDAVLIGSGWWLRPVIAVVLVLGVGLVLRRLVPGWVTSLLQVVVLTLAVAVTFEVGTPRELTEQLGIAAQHIQTSGAPAGVIPAIELVLAAALGLLAVGVDALAVRAPALVAVPALALFATGSTFALARLPWPALVLPAVAYLLLLAVARRRGGGRTSDWGAVTVIGGVAVVLGLVAVTQATSVSTMGRLERISATQGLSGASPFTGLVGDLLRGEELDVLQYASGLPPRYLRSVALTEWTSNEGWSLEQEPSTDRRDGTGSLVPDPGAATTAVGIASLGYTGQFLPVPEGTTAVSAGLPWNVDEALSTWHRDEPTDPNYYQALVDTVLPTADELALDTVTGGGPLVETGDLAPQVRELAIAATQAHETPFAKALALQQWFTQPANGFVYSLRVPDGTSGDLLLDFLQLRRGYCEQYASAMAVMLRSLDIPARVVIGFGSGSTDETGLTTITSHNAHAWVEVLFDGAGWVRFDPTPGGGGQGEASAPGVIGLPEGPAAPDGVDGVDQNGPTAEPDPQPGAGDEPAPAPTDGEPTPSVTTGGEDSRPITVDVPGAESGAAGVEDPWRHIGRGEIALLVLLLLLTGPQAVAWSRGRRRLRTVAGGGPDAGTAAWREIEDLARDHGLPLPPTETARQTALRIADAAHLDAGARTGLDAIVAQVEHRWYAASAVGAGGAVGAAGAHAPVARGAEDGRATADAETAAMLVRTVAAVREGLEHHVQQRPLRWWFPPSLRGRR